MNTNTDTTNTSPATSAAAIRAVRPVAAVTGASSGLGRDFALQLADKGYDLLLVARRIPLLEALKSEIQERHPDAAVEVFPADLADPAQLKKLEERLAQTEHLDVLVNNAGFGFENRTPAEDLENDCRTIQVHVLAPARLTHAALGPMRRRKCGHIVNVSSVAAFLHGADCAQYAASKAWLLSFSKCLCHDVRADGVRVQALCPGLVRTGFHSTPLMDAQKYGVFPNFLWLESRRVVRDSLRNLFSKHGATVCIPSWRYRFFIALLTTPPISWLPVSRKNTAPPAAATQPTPAAPSHRPQLILATGNAHKAAEFARLAAASGLPFEICDASAAGGMPDVPEDTGTFLGNARQKARALRAVAPSDAWVLADDSGLCCNALDGAPGVETANYAGPHATDVANRTKLLTALDNVPDEKRGAHFLCQLVLISPTGSEFLFDGFCKGRILRTERGEGGFGYDPIFQRDGDVLGFAELPPDAKDRVSHRGLAFAKLAAAQLNPKNGSSA
ncbi:MAG: SDR family NAD(P)-dependent oxidoreductase [Puniceicoccales bacterium]|jgi:XTP/dITP diphosphohydrolase|nr:SDR family NAD(P)-dependent oxidoreductase [Puniceicoccales bacterium]